MARYIDAEQFEKELKADICFFKEVENRSSALRFSRFLDRVKSQPTADVAPVVHAHWEYHECVCTDEGITGVYVCSACKAAVPEAVFDFFMEGFHKEFCGSCGAKMDEEVKKDGTQ